MKTAKPSFGIVAVISVLLFLESLIGSFIAITQEGEMPSEIQYITIAGVAALAVITYILSIVRPGK